MLDDRSASPSLGEKLAAFLAWQEQCWPRLARARSQLQDVRTRRLQLRSQQVVLQWNPGRAVSTTAAVDQASIRARPCFLCPSNLPPEEKGLPFERDWVILANPAPILDRHLVVAHREHRPQAVRPALRPMLELARACDGAQAVIYNGPSSGASAPDHLHLQAVEGGSLPAELAAWQYLDLHSADPGRFILQRPSLAAWTAAGSARSIFCFFGEPRAVIAGVRACIDALGMVVGEPEEPRLNLLATARTGRVLALLFPRAAHRPACYHAPEPERCLVSPGAIDMAGVVVTVRERDFERLDALRVEAIYGETSLPLSRLGRVQELLSRRLAHV